MNASPHNADTTQQAVAAGPNQVVIHNFAFTPKQLTVAHGTRVTWTNDDDVPHVIASVGQKFPSSPPLDTRKQYAYTFAAPGTYDYFCSIHPVMTGQIVVT